jgi:cell division protein FtsB
LERENSRLGLFLLLGALLVVYVFVFGESGILERMELRKNKARLAGRVHELGEENSRLRGLFARYRSGEFLDEEAGKAGYIKPGEKHLYFRNRDRGDGIRDDADAGKEGYRAEISHLRVLWLVVSALVLVFYFARRSRFRADNG